MMICDGEGRILELLRRRPGAPDAGRGGDLREVVHASCRARLAELLAAVQRDGHAVGWEMAIPIEGAPTLFAVTGVDLGGRLLVLAYEGDGDVMRLVEELGRINNEQASELRRALKELSGPRVARPAPDVVAEMSRLNNELATAQRELASRSARLEQLLREKNELLGMAAHDLRSPLAVIHGLAAQLRRDTAELLAPNQVEVLGHIQASSDHMRVLVEELLDVAKIESGTLTLALRPTDLPALVERALRICRELARAKAVTIRPALAGGPDLRAVEVDGQRVTQAIVNLVTNAIKFSRAGEAVEVRLRGEGEVVALEVEDHGVGIAEELLPHLFTPFRCGRPGTEGETSTGLGLAIVRRIARGHGGEVRLRSQVGVGTTVTLLLPLRAGPASEAPARSQEVLVADDDPFSAQIVAGMLTELGHRAETAGSVEEASAAVRARRFDLVLLDLEMPGGGGVAIAGALRERERGADRRTSIVALTGHGGERAVAMTRGHAFDAVLAKPTDPAELRWLLATLER